MRILFLTENFPPETNAAATRVYERACYWVVGSRRDNSNLCAKLPMVGYLTAIKIGGIRQKIWMVYAW